jgi:hypothetical protein
VETASRLLAEARDMPTAKQVVDLAHAAETYARRQKLLEDFIAAAHALKLENPWDQTEADALISTALGRLDLAGWTEDVDAAPNAGF